MAPATISKAQAENLELYQQQDSRKLLMVDIWVQGAVYFSASVAIFMSYLYYES
jgi:hypothetical protein